MVAAAVRGCDCLKAPRCPETPVQLMGFGPGQEGCESSGQQRWVGSVYRVFKTAVLNCIYRRNEQLGCSGSGRVKCWPCPLIPKALEEIPACMELAGPGREGPGQQGRKALCTFWVHLSQFIYLCWCRLWSERMCGSSLFHPLGIFGELDWAS